MGHMRSLCRGAGSVFDADKLGTSSEHKAKRFIDERESAK